jgi:hypothetical protein|tara:strand:- start:45 stop:632 length:588 start_codon:yes stop_codon:yes gene_type:complete
MATAQSPLYRQPDKLDYASPTQFRFGINQLPKVEFFTTEANLPGIDMGFTQQNTPFKDIPIIGDKLTYGSLEITFIVDEYLENYISLHNWMTGLGFPSSRQQFSKFRDVESNVGAGQKAVPSVDQVGTATPDKNLYSDAFLMLLSNKNNAIVEVIFENVFPVSLSSLSYSQNATDVDYMSATCTFQYQIYRFNVL